MKALIFDLDGTLVDTLYAQVLGWQVAFGVFRDAAGLHKYLDELGVLP